MIHNDDNWIAIETLLPTSKVLKRYHVKMVVGSISTSIVETVVLGKLYATGFRFNSGDWQRVTHWKEWIAPETK
jgi:hypothetical protein